MKRIFLISVTATIALVPSLVVGADVPFDLDNLNGAAGIIVSKSSPSLCWFGDIAGGNLVGKPCDTSSVAQHFFYDSSSRGMQSDADRSKCIDVRNCHKGTNQLWQQDSEGRLVVDMFTGKCMTLMSDQSIKQTPCIDSDTQRWLFRVATLPPTTSAPTATAPTSAPVAKGGGDPHLTTFGGETFDYVLWSLCLGFAVLNLLKTCSIALTALSQPS